MIKKLSIVLLLASIGWILIPTVGYACGKDSKKTEEICSKKESDLTQNKSHCNENSCQHENTNKHKACGSDCGHANCKCVHFTIIIALPQEEVLKDNSTNFLIGKQNPGNTDSNLSQGFHSIWQPPKIS